MDLNNIFRQYKNYFVIIILGIIYFYLSYKKNDLDIKSIFTNQNFDYFVLIVGIIIIFSESERYNITTNQLIYFIMIIIILNLIIPFENKFRIGQFNKIKDENELLESKLINLNKKINNFEKDYNQNKDKIKLCYNKIIIEENQILDVAKNNIEKNKNI
jgi:uncharacterized membrane protein